MSKIWTSTLLQGLVIYIIVGVGAIGKAFTSRTVSLSFGLPLRPDQSNACTEYAASAAWLRTVKTTSTSFSSQFLHPTGAAWRKSKQSGPVRRREEAWGQVAYLVQAFDWQTEAERYCPACKCLGHRWEEEITDNCSLRYPHVIPNIWSTCRAQQ